MLRQRSRALALSRLVQFVRKASLLERSGRTVLRRCSRALALSRLVQLVGKHRFQKGEDNSAMSYLNQGLLQLDCVPTPGHGSENAAGGPSVPEGLSVRPCPFCPPSSRLWDSSRVVLNEEVRIPRVGVLFPIRGSQAVTSRAVAYGDDEGSFPLAFELA